MSGLYRKLSEYSASDYYGMHMPGHKRNRELAGADLPYEIDITEIEGFDDLHHPEGILKDAQDQAAAVFGAEETRFLVNGSTVGILSAILGNTRPGDKILVARHCHKSVYHAIQMNRLQPVYIYPEVDETCQLNAEVSVRAVQKILEEHPDIRVAVIVSPTYAGVISDVEKIGRILHERKIPLIVDEAHGAHLGFHPYFDVNSLKKGADVVIHSVHKTLPSLTQTALLHVRGPLANRKRMFRYLDMLQTSSPSYVMMASIDHCVEQLQENADVWFEPYAERLERLRASAKEWKKLKLLETRAYDPSKIVISVFGTKMTGKELYELLLGKYHLQLEMAEGTYAIAMTSVGDTQEGIERLEKALREIDEELESVDEERMIPDHLPVNEQVMICADAVELCEMAGETELVSWRDAIGRVSTEFAYLYPPGSPLIVPGERVSEDAVRLMEQYRECGFHVEGAEKMGYLRVAADKE